MEQSAAIKTLAEWARAGRVVFTVGDLAKLFPADQRRTLLAALGRLVDEGVLARACRGVYVYVLTTTRPAREITDISGRTRFPIPSVTQRSC